MDEASELADEETPRGIDAPAAYALEEILADYVDRLNRGEKILPERILFEHPEEGEEILGQLEAWLGPRRSSGSTSHDKRLGKLGDYTLLRQIGRGGMGIVYEAWQSSVDRPVALKVLPAGVAADTRTVTRFVREAKTAAQLKHPSVVSVFGMGVETDTPYFAMELVDGETLGAILRKMKDTSPEETTPFGFPRDDLAYYSRLARSFADVADGLQHAHSKGVIHRDIKPSNLILDRDGRLRILDFGLARIESQESLTVSGEFVGTPLYMSPEQARRRKIDVDHRTDVYSLGATLYEMIALEPPFRGRDHEETLSQIIAKEPVELRRRNPRVPRELETIVLKCLRKDAGDRYGTTEALAQDLRRFVRGDPIEARPPSRAERIAGLLRRHRTALLLAAGVIVLLLVAGAAIRSQLEKRYAEDVLRYETLVLKGVAKLAFALEAEQEPPNQWTSLAPKALELFSEAASIFPGRVDARFHLARTYLFLGREREAALELSHLPDDFFPASVLRQDIAGRRVEETLEVDPASWEAAWLEACRAFLTWGRRRFAAEQYSELIRRLEGRPEPYLGLRLESGVLRGRCFMGLRVHYSDFEALEEFTVVHARFPRLASPVVMMSLVYWRLGEAEVAARRLSDFLEEVEDREFFVRRVAELYVAVNDLARAREWIARIDDRARQAYFLARLNTKAQRPVEAEAAARRAVELAPDRVEGWFELGRALQSSGRHDEAVAALDRALELDPRLGEAFYCRATSRLETAGKNATLNEWDRFLAERPEDCSRYSLYGVFLESIGAIEESVSVYTAGIERCSEPTTLYYDRGVANLNAGRFEEAIPDLDVAIAVAPNNASALFARGVARYHLADYAAAEADFLRNLEFKPKGARTWIALARSRARLGHVHEARAALDRAKIEDPTAHDLYRIGRVYSILSVEDASHAEEDAGEALGFLRQAFELGFDDFASVRSDPELEIRDRPELSALITEFEQAPPRTPDDR